MKYGGDRPRNQNYDDYGDESYDADYDRSTYKPAERGNRERARGGFTGRREYDNSGAPLTMEEKSKMPCPYLSTQEGCHHGKKCHYDHPILTPE